MMLIRTYVAPSGVEGVGVFAAEPVKEGTLIWRLDDTFDRLLHTNQIETYPPHMQEFFLRYAYPLHDNPEILVLEADNGRFMNHAVRPNTNFSAITKGYAARDIAMGEELLCDYGEFDPSHILLPSLINGAERQGQTVC